MWFNKLSIQFAQPHSKSCFLPTSVFLLGSVCSSYFNFNLSVSRSPILCYCLSCPLATVCYRFPSFFSASAYKPKTLLPPLPRRWKWREKVAKAWLRCQFINTTPWETAWMKAPMPLENYPPSQRVICYTVEYHNKYSNTSTDTQSNKVQTGSRKIRRSGVNKMGTT